MNARNNPRSPPKNWMIFSRNLLGPTVSPPSGSHPQLPPGLLGWERFLQQHVNGFGPKFGKPYKTWNWSFSWWVLQSYKKTSQKGGCNKMTWDPRRHLQFLELLWVVFHLKGSSVVALWSFIRYPFPIRPRPLGNASHALPVHTSMTATRNCACINKTFCIEKHTGSKSCSMIFHHMIPPICSFSASLPNHASTLAHVQPDARKMSFQMSP